MKKIILVPLKRNDRPEDFIPYIEEVARAGMTAVFMVPYPIDGFRWSRAEGGRKAIEEGIRLANYYKWDTNLRKAKDLIARTRDSLSVKGIDVAAELYAGNTRKAVRAVAEKGKVHLIVSRATMAERIAGLFNGANSLWDLFKRPSLSPVLLIHPMSVA